LTDYWVIPRKSKAAFVAVMEDVLDVYTRPHDPTAFVSCILFAWKDDAKAAGLM